MEYYRETVAAMLKGYMLIQMSYMIATTTEKNNYREHAERLRENWIYNILKIQDNVKLETRAANKTMWACDPDEYYNTGITIHSFIFC